MIQKYLNAYYAYARKYDTEPNVLILDDMRNHHEFIYEMRWSKTFLGCDIYIAKNANFGFEFHRDEDLRKMSGLNINKDLRIVRIMRQRLENSVRYNPDPADFMIPISVTNEIIEANRDALEEFLSGNKWNGQW